MTTYRHRRLIRGGREELEMERLRPEEIEQKAFRHTREGFDPEEVRGFLLEVAREQRQLLSDAAVCGHTPAEGDQIDELLRAAAETAGRIQREAEERAERIRAEAEDAAAITKLSVDAQLRHLVAEAERRAADANRSEREAIRARVRRVEERERRSEAAAKALAAQLRSLEELAVRTRAQLEDDPIVVESIHRAPPPPPPPNARSGSRTVVVR